MVKIMLESLQHIIGNIYLVQGINNGRFPFSHSILIIDTSDEAVLIDTGCGIETLEKLRDKFHIYQIINSHTHPDHSAGNWVFENTTTQITVPVEGFSTSGNLLALSERFTEPGTLAEYWRGFVSEDPMNFRECKPTHSYNKNTHFEIGDTHLSPIYSPGHTIDHYFFYEPNHQILFSFDYDLDTSFGPWYGHRESSIPDFKDSLIRIIDLKVKILVSSHRGVIKHQIYRQVKNYYDKFDERTEYIRKLLGSDVTNLAQLVDKAPIYKDFPYAKPLLRYWEGEMILKHLRELEGQGDFKYFLIE
jgi:glyoxylase-like metal-dependent hydrolase (beta-lactamase superfamily II)